MNLAKVSERLEKRYLARQQRLEKQRLEYLEKLRTGISDFVRRFPDVSKVVVFGSLTRKGYFIEISDIDIAVRDLPAREYWNAISWFEEALGTEWIDLVCFEDAHPRVFKYIEAGETLYERKS